MDDDFELDGIELETDGECTTIMRTTVLPDGRLAMTPWEPFLAESGPMGQLLRARERAGVAIADLRLLSSRDVVVEFMAAGRAREKAEAAICRWAADAGHERVWLPGRPPRELPPRPPLATAESRCRVCRARWVDATPGFWLTVDGQGHFPLVCPTCGHTLPQWQVTAGDATNCRG